MPAPDAQSLKDAARRALNAGQHAEALGHLEAAVRVAPEDRGALLELAALYERAGRSAEVWAAYQALVRQAPHDLDVLAPFLGFLVRSGRIEGIMPLYNEVMSLGWRDVAGMAALGHALIPRFQYAEAEQVFSRARALAPDNELVLCGLGITFNALKRFDEAIACLQRVADPKPGQPLLREHRWAKVHLFAARGAAALSAGRIAEATDLFSESIDREKDLLQQTVPAPPPSTVEAPPVHRLLYIEIELKAREFEARVLLALHAAAQGLDVIIGQKTTVAQFGYDKLPAGLFLVKTMNGMDVSRIAAAGDAGHMVVVLDEEAFGGSGGRPLWVRLNTDPQAIARTDLVIAQGQEYADLLRGVFPEAAAKTRVLGSPRVDLYRPEFRAAGGRAATRIVICSQSQICNSKAISFPDLIALHVRGVPMAEELGRQLIAGTRDIFSYELSMVPQLQAVTRALAGKFPDAEILFRPHPAEDPALWERAFAAHANVTVSSAGSLADALGDAKVLIYVSGCATGLEAHFQEVPIIRFKGDGRVPEPGHWISSDMGFPAASPEDVIAALERIGRGETTWVRDREIAAAHFHGLGDGLVCRGVAAALAEAAARRARPDPSALAQLRALPRPKVQNRAFDAAKFPPTDVAEVQTLAARLAAVAGLPVPRIEAFAANVFLFSGVP